MPLPKPVRWILRIVTILLVVLILAVSLIAFTAIPIDLTHYKKIAEPVLSTALGRNVTIDGAITMTTSLSPSFTLEGLHVGNPEGFDGDFAAMNKAHVRVDLLPLLLLKAHVRELAVEGLLLDLREKSDDTATWIVPHTDTKKSAPAEQPKADSKGHSFTLASDSLVLDKLDISNITATYHNEAMKEPMVFVMESWTGNGLPSQPFVMDMRGSFDTHPFTAAIKAGSIKEFLETSKTWLDVTIDVAETTLSMNGMFDLAPSSRAVTVDLALRGDQLDSLSHLIRVKLPTIVDYEATSKFKLTEDRIDMDDFLIRVGSSSLVGTMDIDNSGPLPVADIKLTAPTIDIKDFLPPDFAQPDDPTAQKAPKAAGTATPQQAAKKTTEEVRNFFNPEVLNAFQAALDIKVENVRSGKDNLGSGQLQAQVKDGLFTLDPLTINIPGGSFFFALAGKEGSASLRGVVEDFDFGIIYRMYQPETDMGGTVSLNFALDSKSETLDKLLANANGYIDINSHPENLHAGIVDLWAVNLVASILSRNEDDKGSTVNCAVARMTMKDGILTTDVFAIDTTAMRICGRGQIDFKNDSIDLDVRPSAKKAEYFSLATPLEIRGSFTDFKFGIARGGIFGTAVGFITSPITATARRFGGTSSMPLDGSDICSMIIGAKNRPTTPIKGCLPAKKSYQR